MSNIIFSTIHGSRLYGLNHEHSDNDVFYVTDSTNPKARHHKGVTEDSVYVGIYTFLERAMSGSHQSVEALFSSEKEWYDESWKPFIESIRVTGYDVFEKYERTITKFCFGDFKRRRHAVRLSYNLESLRNYGLFNPKMTERQIEVSNICASSYSGLELKRNIDILIQSE